MNIAKTAALAAATFALATAPALATKPEGTPGGQGSTPPSTAKAYGKYCQNQSKKHVKGQKGTPFSQCVTAMAKAAKDDSVSAKEACKSMSRKKAEGEKKSAFAKCVVAANKLRQDQQEQEQEQTS